MNAPFKKAAITLTLITLPATAVYGACGGGPEESQIIAKIGQLTLDFELKLAEIHAKLFAKGLMMEQILVTATKVATAQVSASGDKTVGTEQASQQAYADHMKELTLSEVADEIVMKAISQGTDPCGTMAKDQAIHAAEQQLPTKVDATYAQVQANKFSGTASAIAARDAQHRSKFCTQDEVDAGICASLGSMPGGSVNTNLLYSNKTDSLSQEAKLAVINNIVGLPDDAPPQNASSSPAVDAYVLAKKQKDAFTGFAAHSLVTIKEENENVLPLLKERSDMYFGDPAKSQAWAQSLAGQDPVGVMRDLLQIQSLQIKNAQMRLQQGMRMETNLASYLEILNQKYNTQNVRTAEARMLSKAASNKVN